MVEVLEIADRNVQERFDIDLFERWLTSRVERRDAMNDVLFLPHDEPQARAAASVTDEVAQRPTCVS